jgi:predicted aconitase with swiveling domain
MFTLEPLNSANCKGRLLILKEPISYWGGIDPKTGAITDKNHPQQGEIITNRLLLIPAIKGSTASSGALLECIYAGRAPSAMLLFDFDACTLMASWMANVLNLTLPVYKISQSQSVQLIANVHYSINNNIIKKSQ